MSFTAFADDIRDIKPPVYFPTNYLLFIIIGIIVVLAAIVFLGLFLKKTREKRCKKPLPPEKTAHQIARESLAALSSENLPEAGRIKEYYFRLSDIIRRYIEDRFMIKAPEMTTEEFLFSLGDATWFSAGHKDLLKEFLNLCDIVKFAKYGPTRKEIDASFSVADRFVEETQK